MQCTLLECKLILLLKLLMPQLWGSEGRSEVLGKGYSRARFIHVSLEKHITLLLS